MRRFRFSREEKQQMQKSQKKGNKNLTVFENQRDTWAAVQCVSCRRRRRRQGPSLFCLQAVEKSLYFILRQSNAAEGFKIEKHNLIFVVKFHTACCVENGL